MKFTNKHGLPEPLARALSSNKYSRGDARKSVTALLGSPRIDILKERHAHEIEVDVIDRLWAVFGTTVHTMLEEGSADLDEYVAEERLFTDIDGWRISGGIDVQHYRDGKVGIRDWKVTSSYAVINGKLDWERQLNTYAYLVEKEKGLEVRDIQIGAIIRDWKRFEAERNGDYPQRPMVMIDIPLWSYAQREAFLLERVRIHKEASRLAEWGEELPLCTPEEMWEKPSSWAVIRPGNKRATAVCYTEVEAQAKAENIGAEVHHRPGERTRCESYCEVSKFCSQHKAYLASKKEE